MVILSIVNDDRKFHILVALMIIILRLFSRHALKTCVFGLFVLGVFCNFLETKLIDKGC